MNTAKVDFFVTHTGELVRGERFYKAVKEVAADMRRLAEDIKLEDAYASHVTEATKREAYQKALRAADDFEASGFCASYIIAQRLNEKLTGKCIGLLELSPLPL